MTGDLVLSQRRPGVRVLEVVGDSMAPTLVPGSAALVVPADRYASDGLYVIEEPGGLAIVRIAHIGGLVLRVSRDNPAYSAFEAPGVDVDALIVGRVAGIVSILEPSILR